ncbi:hypothetical protein [Spirochaeta isovalerica]|uniref:Uncharacterized protein n=1 Tax=Spirochaeta isovalerica TaxID=150 RepID=A0A841R9P7_9SPIO|nr:hypothetical protein [Spirochaeta isovalerica]MBB6479659.1 hypothetical protein [Spirochaeta isovalerica]
MDEAAEFKKEREEMFGGKIRFMSYARYIGEAGGARPLNIGGLLFVINDTIHFEDFESQNALMSLMGQNKKYSKTEFSLELDDISVLKEIREKHASECVSGMLPEDEILNAPGGLTGLFFKSVIQLLLKGKPSIFFDFLDKEGFKNLVNEYMLRPE